MITAQKQKRIIIIGSVDEISRHSRKHTKTFEKSGLVKNKFIYRNIDDIFYQKTYTVIQKGKEKKFEHVFHIPESNMNRSERRRREKFMGYRGRYFGLQKSNNQDRTKKKNKRIKDIKE